MGEVLNVDPWFWSHYRDAAGIVRSLVPLTCLQPGQFVVDFGCGDGATALGIAREAPATVIGIDLYRTFERLSELSRENLGEDFLPPNLSFRQNTIEGELPLPDSSVDLVYSWSVFEHLAHVPGVLAQLRRVLKPGGALFIQIEPLFYSPFGSHLRRLVDEPWAHLSREEGEFLAIAASAEDNVPSQERDVLYRTHGFDEVKHHLIAEYRKLNRLTADQLVTALAQGGFAITWCKRLETELSPPETLLSKFPRELLVTDQVVLFARKT